MKNQFDLIVIGAGSGGLVAASTARSLGASVLLIESRKMGGDCLNYGCVPSKAFLKSCHLMKQIKTANNYGIKTDEVKPDFEAIMDRVHDVIAQIAPHDSVERFTDMGAKVVLGKGEITSKNTVKVGEEEFSGKKIIIATGSSANIPHIKGLDSVKFHTNESIFELRKQPKEMVILGGGPIGLELGQGFSELGTKVHIVDRAKRVFSKDEPEVADVMEKVFKEDGLNLHMESSILGVEQEGDVITVKTLVEEKEVNINCDLLLVALGRTPNTSGLGLDKVGIKTDARGYIEVNDKLQTSISNIYAVGDVRGKYQFTHTAGYEAAVAVKNALIKSLFKTNYKNIAWTTYTSPEVAHVGVLEKDAKDASVQIVDLATNDRARTDGDIKGFVKVILDKKRRVIGATVVGEKAGDMLPILSLMISEQLPLSVTLDVIFQYPIVSESIKRLAINDLKANVKQWQMNILEKIVKS